jgi:excisionase family DNA binding protein
MVWSGRQASMCLGTGARLWVFGTLGSGDAPDCIALGLPLSTCTRKLDDVRRSSSRDSLIEALVAEMDQALADLQSARKLVTQLQFERGRRSIATHHGGGAAAGGAASMRYSGMTVAEAAALLEVGEEQVRRLLRSGELTGVPYGGRVGWRLSREYVELVAAQWRAQRAGQVAARSRQEREGDDGGIPPMPGSRPPGRPRRS